MYHNTLLGGSAPKPLTRLSCKHALSFTMSTPSTSKPGNSSAKVDEPQKEEEAQPTLGVLEEDDEFEEFAVAGIGGSRSEYLRF